MLYAYDLTQNYIIYTYVEYGRTKNHLHISNSITIANQLSFNIFKGRIEFASFAIPADFVYNLSVLVDSIDRSGEHCFG